MAGKEAPAGKRHRGHSSGNLHKARQLLTLLEKVLPRDANGRAVILGESWDFATVEQLALMEEQSLDRDIRKATTELERQNRQRAKQAAASDRQQPTWSHTDC